MTEFQKAVKLLVKADYKNIGIMLQQPAQAKFIAGELSELLGFGVKHVQTHAFIQYFTTKFNLFDAFTPGRLRGHRFEAFIVFGEINRNTEILVSSATELGENPVVLHVDKF